MKKMKPLSLSNLTELSIHCFILTITPNNATPLGNNVIRSRKYKVKMTLSDKLPGTGDWSVAYQRALYNVDPGTQIPTDSSEKDTIAQALFNNTSGEVSYADDVSKDKWGFDANFLF